MTTPSPRFLTVYAGVMTIIATTLVLTSGASQLSKQKIDVLDVQRINVREPDGTLRFVLTNKAAQPGLIIKGKEYPHPRPQAALLLFNDEGTEVGGLGAGGKNGNGEGSLSFDAQNQDQIVQIIGATYQGQQAAGMVVNDMPTNRNIEVDIQEMDKLNKMTEAERNKLMQQRQAAGYYGQSRMFVGKQDGNAMIALADSKGKPRLMLKVTPDGTTTIDVLDASGKVVNSLIPAKK